MAMIVREYAAASAARCAAAVLLGSLVASVANAGLGEPVDSVARDHQALRGTTLSVTAMQAYDVHETTTADGTRVRQYVSRAGTVFAVAWSGRSLPDLRIVLATHYDRYVAAAAAHRGSHHLLSVATPEVQMNIVRLPRGFAGSAQVPTLMPPGTSAEELR
jgi:hypothetical protein